MSHHTPSHACTCPSCGGVGKSVAAMNYAETQRFDKRGTFAGAGVGVGTGGLGGGVGAGVFSAQGEQQSKRAATFSEPTRFTAPVLGVVIVVLIALMVYTFMPSLIHEMIVENASSATDPTVILSDALMPVFAIITPLMILLIAGLTFMSAFQAQGEADRLNKDVFPKQVSRYSQLRYCEDCHVLFDPQGRSAAGSEYGFAQMMAHLDSPADKPSAGSAPNGTH